MRDRRRRRLLILRSARRLLAEFSLRLARRAQDRRRDRRVGDDLVVRPTTARARGAARRRRALDARRRRPGGGGRCHARGVRETQERRWKVTLEKEEVGASSAQVRRRKSALPEKRSSSRCSRLRGCGRWSGALTHVRARRAHLRRPPRRASAAACSLPLRLSRRLRCASLALRGSGCAQGGETRRRRASSAMPERLRRKERLRCRYRCCLYLDHLGLLACCSSNQISAESRSSRRRLPSWRAADGPAAVEARPFPRSERVPYP